MRMIVALMDLISLNFLPGGGGKARGRQGINRHERMGEVLGSVALGTVRNEKCFEAGKSTVLGWWIDLAL